VKKTLALICLVALSVVYGCSAALTSYAHESTGDVTPLGDRGPHPRPSPALVVDGIDVTPLGDRGPHP